MAEVERFRALTLHAPITRLPPRANGITAHRAAFAWRRFALRAVSSPRAPPLPGHIAAAATSGEATGDCGGTTAATKAEPRLTSKRKRRTGPFGPAIRPAGETISRQGENCRADQMMHAVSVGGDVALSVDGHMLRVLTARWLEQTPMQAAFRLVDRFGERARSRTHETQ